MAEMGRPGKLEETDRCRIVTVHISVLALSCSVSSILLYMYICSEQAAF